MKGERREERGGGGLSANFFELFEPLSSFKNLMNVVAKLMHRTDRLFQILLFPGELVIFRFINHLSPIISKSSTLNLSRDGREGEGEGE